MGWREITRRIMEHVKTSIAEDITYLPKNGSPIELRAVCDEAYQWVDTDTGVEVSSTSPMVGIKIDDLPGEPDRSGDRVTMRGKTYRVMDYQSDGQAAYRVILHRKADI